MEMCVISFVQTDIKESSLFWSRIFFPFDAHPPKTIDSSRVSHIDTMRIHFAMCFIHVSASVRGVSISHPLHLQCSLDLITLAFGRVFSLPREEVYIGFLSVSVTKQRILSANHRRAYNINYRNFTFSWQGILQMAREEKRMVPYPLAMGNNA